MKAIRRRREATTLGGLTLGLVVVVVVVIASEQHYINGGRYCCRQEMSGVVPKQLTQTDYTAFFTLLQSSKCNFFSLET